MTVVNKITFVKYTQKGKKNDSYVKVILLRVYVFSNIGLLKPNKI